MTAIVIVAQPKHDCIHFATDAAIYQSDQTVVCYGSKVFPVAHWPGIITAAGNAATVPLFGWSLSQEYATFDEAVANAELTLPKLAVQYELPNGAQLFFVGMSSRGPEAYVARTDNRPPPGITVEEMERNPYWGRLYQLIKLPDQVQSPVPDDQVIPAHYEGVDPNDSVESALWSIRKMLEMQRQTKLLDGIGAIGGFGQVTTIYADRIEQRILCRWPDDKIGAVLKPYPIDWNEWHAANPRPVANRPIQLSRVRQDMLDRKSRKVNR